MNKIYRVIFNKARGIFMAVSELTNSHSKEKSSVEGVSATGTVRRATLAPLFVAGLIGAGILAPWEPAFATMISGGATNLAGCESDLNGTYTGAILLNPDGSNGKACSNTRAGFSVSIGYKSYAANVDTVAIGNEALIGSQGKNSVVVGAHSNTSFEGSTVVGAFAQANSDLSTVIGYQAIGSAGGSVTAVGASALARARQAVAVGNNAAANEQSTALGSDVYAIGKSSVAIGNDDIQSANYQDKLPVETINKIYQGLYTGTSTNKDIYNGDKAITPYSGTGFKTYGGWEEKGSFYYSYIQSHTQDERTGNWSTHDQRIFSPTYAAKTGAIAIGSRTVAGGEMSTSLGSLSFALADRSTAVGLRSFVASDAVGGTAMGEQSFVFAPNSVAIGNKVETTAKGAFAYGYNAKAVGEGSLAFGYGSAAAAQINTAAYTQMDQLTQYLHAMDIINPTTGKIDEAKRDEYNHLVDLMITGSGSGDASKATVNGQTYTIKGIETRAKDNELFVPDTERGEYLDIGGNKVYRTVVSKEADGSTPVTNAIAIGRYAFALDTNTTALGYGTIADAKSGIAIGSYSHVTSYAPNSVALGVNSYANGENSLVAGYSARSYANDGLALGVAATTGGMLGALSPAQLQAFRDKGYKIVTKAETESENFKPPVEPALIETTLPNGAKTYEYLARNSAAVGKLARATAYNSMAIGNGSRAYFTNSVALGVNSSTDYSVEDLGKPGWVATGAIAIPTSAATGVISVGAINQERRITNVASGYRDSDAVNVAQLRTLDERISNITGSENSSGLFQYMSIETKKSDGKAGALAQVVNKERNYSEYITLRKQYLGFVARNKLNGETIDSGALGKIKDRIDELSAGTNFSTLSAKLTEVENELEGISPTTDKTQYDAVVAKLTSGFDTDSEATVLTAEEQKTKKQVNASNFKNDGAVGKDSLAVGWRATTGTRSTKIENGETVEYYDEEKAKGDHAIAAGFEATATGQNAIAMGSSALVNNVNTLTRATGANSLAIGTAAQATGEKAIALGAEASATWLGSISIGGWGERVDDDGTHIPNKATGKFAIAVGTAAQANAHDSIAIGRGTVAGGPGTEDGQNAIAIGWTSQATAESAVSLGEANTSSGYAAISIGRLITASGINSVAIGAASKATADKAIAIGSDNNKWVDDRKTPDVDESATKAGVRSIAIGSDNKVSGEKSIAIGTGHTVSGANSGAFGDPNTINYDNSYIVGNNSTIGAATTTATEAGSFVLGNNVNVTADKVFVLGSGTGTGDNRLQAQLAESVYLGYGSAQVTAAASRALGSAYQPTLWGKTYNGGSGTGETAAFAGNNPTSIVTIGSDTISRLLQGVAAGTISATSTDAINGSQLFAIVSSLRNDITTATQNAGVNWFNVKSTPDSTTAGDNYDKTAQRTGALGQDSIAIGKKATANTADAIAIGLEAKTGAGSNVTATLNDNSIAIGYKAMTAEGNAVSIGQDMNHTGGAKSVVLGYQAGRALAGGDPEATGTVGTQAVIIGNNAYATDIAGVAIGANAGASGHSAVGVGVGTVASGRFSAALAQGARATGMRSLALGSVASATADFAAAVGRSAQATATGATALGNVARATATQTTAVGAMTNASVANAVAIGANSEASTVHTGGYLIAGATGEASGAASDANAVTEANKAAYDALVQAVADAQRAYDTAVAADKAARLAELNTAKSNLTTFENSKTLTAFSVGSAGKERQIQHVAAGVVSATSTDAINGSQLYATNKYLTDLAERAGLDGKPINGIDGAKGQDGADGTTIAGADGAKGDAGRDGIPGGSGVDGNNGADGTPGLAGPAGRDGQSDTTLANKVQSLRDGVSGTVVYTDAAGNRVLAENGQYYNADLVKNANGTTKLVKHTDGLWYDKDSFDADGTLKTEAKGTGKSLAQLDQAAIDAAVAALGAGADETAKANAKKTATKAIASNDVILSAVNPDGKTATPVTLGNIASVLGIPAATPVTTAAQAVGYVGKPAQGSDAATGLFALSGANLNRAVTAADLQALAVAGVNFGDRTGNVVNIPLGGQFNVYGDSLLDGGKTDKYVTTATTTDGVKISLTDAVTNKLDALPDDTKGTIDAIALNIAGDKSSKGKITLKDDTLAITGNADLETAASNTGVTLTLQKSESVNSGDAKVVTSGAAFTAITGAKTKVALAEGSDGALTLTKAETTDLDGNVYTLSLDKSKLATNLGDTFAKKNASNLEDADVTAWKDKLGIAGMASSGAGITFKGNGTGSQDAKVKLDSTLNIEGAADEIVAVTSGGGTAVGKLSLSLAQAVKDKLGKIPTTGDLVTTARKITLKAGATSTNAQTLASDVAFNIDGSEGVTTIASGSTVSVKITDAGVTAAKLANDAVTTDKIKDGNVTKAKLADGSVDSSKIVDGSVAETDLTTELQTKLGGIDAWKNATIQLAGDNNTATKAVKLSETPIKFTIKGNDDIVTTAAQDGTLSLALQKATVITNTGNDSTRVVTSSLVYGAIAGAKPTVKAAPATAGDNNLIKVNGSKSAGISGDTFSVSLSENDLVTTLNNYYVNKTSGGGITFLDNTHEVNSSVPKVTTFGETRYLVYEKDGIRYYQKENNAQDTQFYVRGAGGTLTVAEDQDATGKVQLMNTVYGDARPQSQTIALGNKLQFVGDGYVTVEYDQASYRDGEAPRLKVKVTDAVLDALEDLKVGDFSGSSSLSYKANATGLQKVSLLQGLDFRGESTASSANKNIDVSLGTDELANKGVVNFSLNENLQGIQSIGSGLRANTDDTSEARLTFHSADTSTTPAKAAYIEANNVKLTGLADGEVKAGSKDAITGGQLSKFLGINSTEHGSIGDRITNLENGLKGTVVYTDKDGNRLVKTSDGKYYKVADTLDKGYHFYNNQWYDDADWDDDKGTPLNDSVTAQTVAEFTASESNPVMLSLVDSQNQTTSPITLANLASALGLATKVGTAALADKDTAQTTVITLLGKKGADLGRAATVADLQALALAGIDFVGNQDADANSKANRIRASIGSLVKIEGKSGATYGTGDYVATNYSADNLITYKDGDALRIAMKTKPSFEALTLQPSGAGALPVTLTPSKTTDGQPTLALSSGSGDAAQPVVLKGVAAGTDGKDAVNMDQLNAVKNAIGMNGNGTDGSRGPAGKDGLDGQSLSNQVKALRDGLAGTVVYTDKQGTRLLSDDGQYYYKEKLIEGKKKAIDGKWYAVANVNDDGTVKDSAKNTGKTLAELNTAYVQTHPDDTQFVQTSEVILSAVDPSGETAAKPITLANLLGALNNPASSTVTSVDKVKALLAGKDPATVDTNADTDTLPDGDLNLSRVATAADLKVLAEAGLGFQGDDGQLVARQLSETLKVTGDSTDYSKFSGAAGNIAVKKNSAGDGLLIQLAKDLANIESIGSGAKGDAYAARITFTAGKAAANNQPAVDPTISMNSAKVTGVLAGDVSASSKDAVNGSQLYSVQSALGAGFEWKDGKLVGDNIANTGKNNIVEAMQALQTTASNAAGGFSVAGDSTTGAAADKVAPGDTLSIKGVANSGIATKMDKANDALTISINNKTKFGAHAGIEAITGTSSQLVQEKAVKNYVDGLAERFGSGMSVNGVDGFDGETGKPGTPGQPGVPGVPGKDGKGNTLVGPAGQDGLNGTTIVNKVQSLRDGVAGTMVYTDTNGKRVLAENGKYYDTSVVGDKVKATNGKWYDRDKVNADGSLKNPADTTGQTLAQLNAASKAAGTGDKSLTNDKVILSAVNPDGETTSPVTIANLKDNLAGVTPTEAEVNQALSDLGLNPADVTDAQKASVKSKLAGKKASEEVAKLLGIDGSTEAGKAQLSRAVTLHDLQTVAQAGLDFVGNDGVLIHRALGTTLNIKGSNVVYTKSTLDSNGQPTATNIGNSHLYAADNLITHADGDDTVRIEMKKTPTFDGIVLDGKPGTDGQGGKDGYIGVDADGNVVVKNGVDGLAGTDGTNGKDGASRVITEKDLTGADASVKLTYSANGKGKGGADTKATTALDTGLNFVNGDNTTASIDANGNIKYDLNKDLSGITSISSGKAKDDSGKDKDNSVEAKITLTPGEKGQDKDGKDVITKAPTVDVGGSRITNVADPTENSDAANKGYVDTEIRKVGGNVTEISNKVENLSKTALGPISVKDDKGGTFSITQDNPNLAVKGDSKNISVTAKATDNSLTVELNKNIELDSVKTGDVSVSKDGINAGGKTVTNVGEGTIGAGSKDAVTGGQIADIIGKDAIKDGKVTDIGGTGASNLNDAIKTIYNTVAHPVDVKAGANIVVDKTVDKGITTYTVSTSSKLAGESVTVGKDGTNTVTINNIDTAEDPSIRDGANVLNVNGNGNEKGTIITGVADGQLPTDAVNVRQLNQVASQVANLDRKVEKYHRNANAGTATAIAIASLPQAADAGANMVSLAGGSYDGETATAIGISRRSDNGKFIIKANGSYNSRGKVGVGVGVGFQWR